MKLPIYLDYAATTPVDKRVVRKMNQYLTLDGIFGNASSSSHYYGWQAEEAIDVARTQIAMLIGADPREIVFTSGSTESINLAIKGVCQYYSSQGGHIITSATEHKAVLEVCAYLESQGFSVTRIIPQKNGLISLDQISEVVQDNTILLSIMHVNNEIGVIQDIELFGNFCRQHKILFHVDATQSVGKLPINLSNLPVDLMSFNAHKLYGPKGIGGLYICHNSNISVITQIHGGGHEYGLRSGTLPVHQIVGMGEAYQIAREQMETNVFFIKKLCNKLRQGLEEIDEISFNGDLEHNVQTLLNVTFNNIDSEMFVVAFQDLAVSFGSACVSLRSEPSHVLRALGLTDKLSYSSVRFSFGRFTTEEEIDYALNQIRCFISKFRINNNFFIY